MEELRTLQAILDMVAKYAGNNLAVSIIVLYLIKKWVIDPIHGAFDELRTGARRIVALYEQSHAKHAEIAANVDKIAANVDKIGSRYSVNGG